MKKIISCNNLGFTIYCKKIGQYILDVRHKTNFEIINALEIKPNQIILFQKNMKHSQPLAEVQIMVIFFQCLYMILKKINYLL